MSQTVPYDSGAVRIGSAKLEVGATIESLADLGAMNGVSFKETYDRVKIMSENAGKLKDKIKNHQATIAGTWLEPNLTKLNTMRGIDNYEVIAGTQVTGKTQTVAANGWAFNKFIPFEYKNADGTAPTVSGVAAATDGSLVKDTDYYVGKNEKGDWGLFVIDSAKVTTVNQNLTITMTYTPVAAKVLTSGGATVLSSNVVRVTNTNEDGKIFQVTIYKAEADSGIELPFPGDDDDNPMGVPISLTGTPDTSRAVKDQLFKLYDEQGIL